MKIKVKKSLQRRVIRERLHDDQIDFYPIGSISDIARELKRVDRNLRRKYHKFEWFELDWRFDEDTELLAVGCRWESDNEYKARQEKLKKATAKRREKLIIEKPYICPHCGTRYKLSKYIQGDMCPACMEV